MEYIFKNPKIYIISGKAKSGKDKLAYMIIGKYKNKKCIKLSYSHYLKEYVKKITGWNGLEETKPRTLLQEFGINFLKNKIDDKLLINRLITDIKVYSYFYDVIVITDARLKEEVELPRKEFDNVVTIRIKGEDNNLSITEKEHITETNLDNYNNFDYVLNYKTLEEQFKSLEREFYEK